MAIDAAKLDEVGLDALKQEHPEYRAWSRTWESYRLLYRGGEEFLLAAGQTWTTRASTASGGSTIASFADSLAGAGNNRRRRFLYQLEGEPNVKYISRWERAFFIGYIGAIVDYFRGWLFSHRPDLKLAATADGDENPEPPVWFRDFAANCNGGGKDLIAFMRDVFLDAMVCRRAGWLVGSPGSVAGLSEADAQASGEPRVVLTPYAAEGIVNWDRDTSGRLKWVLLRKIEHEQEWPDPRRTVETYTYLDDANWRTWEVTQGTNGQSGIETIGAGEHGCERIPFVLLELPEGLWPVNKLASWQIDLFNKMSMLSYGQLVACYPQPFIKTNEPGAAGRVFGEGLLLELRAGRGDDRGEEFGWITASTEPLRFVAEQLKEQRDEGYRIIHQMSLAVDSAAVGAIARSGVSKLEDRRASEVILGFYGSLVREALTETLDLISQVFGDGARWVCDGFDDFAIDTPDEELTNLGILQSLGIPSPTMTIHAMQNIATGRSVGKLDEATKAKIRSEIAEAVEMQQEGADVPPLPPEPPEPPEPDALPDEEAPAEPEAT